MPRELPPPGASRHPPHEDGGGMKTADAVALFAMTVCAPPLPATTRVIASSRSLLAMTSRTIHTFLLLSRNRGERSSLFLIPPTFVGSRRAKLALGWHIVSGASDVTGGGCFVMRELAPPGASRHPPHKSGRDKTGAVALYATRPVHFHTHSFPFLPREETHTPPRSRRTPRASFASCSAF